MKQKLDGIWPKGLLDVLYVATNVLEVLGVKDLTNNPHFVQYRVLGSW